MRASLNFAAVVSLCVLGLTLVSSAEPPARDAGARQKGTPASAQQTEEHQRAPLTLAEARQRAELAHNFYSATLDAMHRSYFTSATAPVPARVMERMFKDVEREENLQARWIAVNARAMSIDHEPDTDFEKTAAKEIAAGKGSYERVENGVYQRAGAISLMNHGCLTCHHGFGKKNTKDRFAGLIISIPVQAAGK